MNALPVRSALTPGRAARAEEGLDILDPCHRRILDMLEDLSAMVAALEVDGLTTAIRARAATIAAFFCTTARDHHEDEQRYVFPPLLESGRPDIVEAVLKLQRDHDGLEEDWFDVAPHVLAVAQGDRSYDLGALREGVSALAALYHDHIALEEACIHRQARHRTPVGRQSETGREMAAHRRAGRAAGRGRAR